MAGELYAETLRLRSFILCFLLRATHEQLLESTLKSQRTQLGLKVLARMKYIKSLQKNSSALHDYK